MDWVLKFYVLLNGLCYANGNKVLLYNLYNYQTFHPVSFNAWFKVVKHNYDETLIIGV